MAYIILSIQDGLRYYVQTYKGKVILNGLKENADKYANEEIANELGYRYQEELGIDLFIEEVLPPVQK